MAWFRKNQTTSQEMANNSVAGHRVAGIGGDGIGSQHGLEGFLLETGEVHERVVLGRHGEYLLA